MERSSRQSILVVKVSMRAPNRDVEYWQTQSYQARIDALEEIRREYHLWKYGNAEPKLRRVYTIIKRQPSSLLSCWLLHDCNLKSFVRLSNLQLSPIVLQHRSEKLGHSTRVELPNASMPKAYSQDLREKTIAAIDCGVPKHEVISMFTSVATAYPIQNLASSFTKSLLRQKAARQLIRKS